MFAECLSRIVLKRLRFPEHRLRHCFSHPEHLHIVQITHPACAVPDVVLIRLAAVYDVVATEFGKAQGVSSIGVSQWVRSSVRSADTFSQNSQ